MSRVCINPTVDGGFGNTPQVNYEQSSDGNTITATVENAGFGFFGSGSVNLDVTVPGSADLQVKTGSGDIEVNGVGGQMSLTTGSGSIDASKDTLSGQSTLQTGSGSIDATQDTLSGQSTLHTGSGDITLNGSLDPNGNYRLETGSGSIETTLPSNPSVHVDAATGSGSITSAFAELSVQSPDTHEVHGDIGNPPRAELTLQTGSGSISLNKH